MLAKSSLKIVLSLVAVGVVGDAIIPIENDKKTAKNRKTVLQ